MVRFPHDLFWLKSTESPLDASGDFIAGTERERFIAKCRTEPNGSGRLISLNDGKAYQYSSLIFVQAVCSDLKEGESVIVKSDGAMLYQAQILRISYDQKHCRIWV